MSAPFNTTPEGPPIVPTITLRTAQGITPLDTGLVNIHFARREFGRSAVVVYARIPDVPHGMEGRAIAVWILAHPWRIVSIVRMVHAYALYAWRRSDMRRGWRS